MIRDKTYERCAPLVLAFIQQHGRRPSSTDPNEARIRWMFRVLTEPAHRKDDQFKQMVARMIGPVRKGPPKRSTLSLYRLFKWIKQHGRRPHGRSKDSEERGLANRMYVLCARNPKIRAAIRQRLSPLGNPLMRKCDQTRLNCLDFIRRNNRWPRCCGNDPEPKLYLAIMYARRIRKSNAYAEQFLRDIDAVCPRVWKYQTKGTGRPT